jgi:magnesium-transporting ATPase (P-type)
MPLSNQARLLLLSRSLWGLSIVLLMTRIIIFRTMSMWAQLPYVPAHPTPVDDRSITYHAAPFIGWCLNHGYLFFLFFFATLIFMTIVETKSRAPRPRRPANLS